MEDNPSGNNENPAQMNPHKAIVKNEHNKPKNISSITPGNEDSEVQKYYKDLEKEKEKEEKEKKEKEKEEKEKKEKEKEKEKENNNSNNQKQNLNLDEAFSFKKYKKAPMVILENEENTNYMNCVIQCLANNKSIASYYLKNLDEFKHHIQDMPLTYAFSRIIFHLYPYPQDSLKKSFSLSGFHKAFVYMNPSFYGKDPKNPNEFLVYLLEALHEEDKKMSLHNNKNDKNNNNNSVFIEYIKYLNEYEKSCIFNNFCWINQKIKKCLQCNNDSTIYQNFFTYDLNFINVIKNKLEKNISVEDCLKFISEKKEIEMYCNICNKRNKFIVENTINFSPNEIIFLIRGYNKIIKDKIKKENFYFTYNDSINLNKYNKEDKIIKSYSLNGFIAFDIREEENMKYISYCLNPIDNKWYKYYDDNNVNKIQKMQDDFILKLEKILWPVILFYKQK